MLTKPEALGLLRHMGGQMADARQRSCRSGEALTWVSKDRLERWARELVDIERAFTRYCTTTRDRPIAADVASTSISRFPAVRA